MINIYYSVGSDNLHYKNKKQGQLNGVIDKDKKRYDELHGGMIEWKTRSYKNALRLSLSNTDADYFLGMTSTDFIKQVESNEELILTVRKFLTLNLLSDMKLVLENQLNDNVNIKVTIIHEKKKRYSYIDEKNNIYRMSNDYYLSSDYNFCYIEIDGVLCRMYIDIEVLKQEFDTPNIKLVNAIISTLTILDSDYEFKHTQIGGLARINDTNNYFSLMRVYADNAVFKNLDILHHTFIGYVYHKSQRDFLENYEEENFNMSETCINSLFCECLNCRIYSFINIKDSEYGLYRRFGNIVVFSGIKNKNI